MTLINAPSALVADRFEEFDMPEWLKGLTFLFSNIPFTITSLLLHKFSSSKSKNKSRSIKIKKAIIWWGYLLLCIGFLLIGPSTALHFPQEVWLILIGFSFFGVSYASLIVSSIPLLQDYALQYDTVDEEYSRVMNYISGLFNLFFGTGGFLGFLLPSSIKGVLGYTGLTDVFSLVTIFGLVVFIMFSWMPLSKNLSSHLIENSNNVSKTNNLTSISDQKSEIESQLDQKLLSK